MECVIKHAKIYDVQSDLNGQRHTLWLREGKLYALNRSAPAHVKVIQGEDLCVSPTWLDLRAHFCDPGEEHKENLNSGAAAALAGGFAEVALLPDTKPTIQSKAQLAYIQDPSKLGALKIHPIAALTEHQKGQQLNELLDLHAAGVRAFSDGCSPLYDITCLERALSYLRPTGAVLMHRPVLYEAAAHEGTASTQLGLSASPAYYEALAVQQAVEVLRYTGGRLHLSCLSSQKSLKIVSQAQAEGLALSADVAVHQLLFDESVLYTLDAQHKVRPPYRAASDKKALCKAVQAGHLQAIVSDHRPQAIEDKMHPFEAAAAGIINLQCVLPMLLRIEKTLALDASLRALYLGSREVLNLPAPTIKLHHPVHLTVFDKKKSWRFDHTTNHSKSTNSPLFDQELQGRVEALVLGPKIQWM